MKIFQEAPLVRRLLLLIVTLLLTIFYGCTTKQLLEKTSPPIDKKTETEIIQKINPGFLGTWASMETSAQFRIQRVDKKYKIVGWDNADGELFKISNITWTENALGAVITMPSTQHRIKIDLTIVGKNKLQCLYSGDRFGKFIWRRKFK